MVLCMCVVCVCAGGEHEILGGVGWKHMPEYKYIYDIYRTHAMCVSRYEIHHKHYSGARFSAVEGVQILLYNII